MLIETAVGEPHPDAAEREQAVAAEIQRAHADWPVGEVRELIDLAFADLRGAKVQRFRAILVERFVTRQLEGRSAVVARPDESAVPSEWHRREASQTRHRTTTMTSTVLLIADLRRSGPGGRHLPLRLPHCWAGRGV